MKIGLLFGSFNPIHTGHLIIANHIANFYTDEVWFIVSPHNPFKRQQDLLDAEQRLNLVKAAIEKDKRFKISDIEFYLSKPSYTINTLKKLSETHPQHTFQIIMGSDNVLNLSNWKSSEEIVNNYQLLVYERPGYEIKSNNLHLNVHIIQSELLNISASIIRDLIKEGKNIKYLVPEKVRLIIKKYGYYK